MMAYFMTCLWKNTFKKQFIHKMSCIHFFYGNHFYILWVGKNWVKLYPSLYYNEEILH